VGLATKLAAELAKQIIKGTHSMNLSQALKAAENLCFGLGVGFYVAKDLVTDNYQVFHHSHPVTDKWEIVKTFSSPRSGGKDPKDLTHGLFSR
jgi:hypothetical protein